MSDEIFESMYIVMVFDPTCGPIDTMAYADSKMAEEMYEETINDIFATNGYNDLEVLLFECVRRDRVCPL
jgi:hypothetical protein